MFMFFILYLFIFNDDRIDYHSLANFLFQSFYIA
jgi:hypothetical protein